MNHERREVSAAEDRRARTLRLLLPPVIHRLNNKLAVLQLVNDLGSDAGDAERLLASDALVALRDTLEPLALHARSSGASPDGAVARAPSLFRTQRLLVLPLARTLRVEYELGEVPLPLGADERLAGLFLDLCVALLGGHALEQNPRPRVRLAGDVRDGQVRLRLSAYGLEAKAGALAALDALARLARADGFAFAARSSAHAFGVCVGGIPASAVTPSSARAVRAARRRLLFLHADGAVREEVAAVLRENAFMVTETADEPANGAFELALVEQRRALAEPGLCARLQARFALRRVVELAPRTSPARILELLRA